MEAYIKYLKIFVVFVWALVLGGAVYFLFGPKQVCDVSVAGKCYSQANLKSVKFSVQGNLSEGTDKIDNPSKLTLPKFKQ